MLEVVLDKVNIRIVVASANASQECPPTPFFSFDSIQNFYQLSGRNG